VQQGFFAPLGSTVMDNLSPTTADQLDEVSPREYYAESGYDGFGLRVPTDLDESICLYLKLPAPNRAKFDRAAFWVDMATQQWQISMSSSFASLVSAVESLTDRGTTHELYCATCNNKRSHDVPDATERFRAFFENCSRRQLDKSPH